MPADTAIAARLPSFYTDSQRLEQMASAMTMDGTPEPPIILTGADDLDYKTVVDNRDPDGLLWHEGLGDGGTIIEGARIYHLNKLWESIDYPKALDGDQVEPGVGNETAAYWTLVSSSLEPLKHTGRKIAKVTIQNVGTAPLVVTEGEVIPTASLFHLIIPGGTAENDGLGGFAQWDNFKGCIRITSTGNPWRAAVKIIWR